MQESKCPFCQSEPIWFERVLGSSIGQRWACGSFQHKGGRAVARCNQPRQGRRKGLSRKVTALHTATVVQASEIELLKDSVAKWQQSCRELCKQRDNAQWHADVAEKEITRLRAEIEHLKANTNKGE